MTILKLDETHISSTIEGPDFCQKLKKKLINISMTKPIEWIKVIFIIKNLQCLVGVKSLMGFLITCNKWKGWNISKFYPHIGLRKPWKWKF